MTDQEKRAKLLAAAEESMRAGRQATGIAFAALAGQEWAVSQPLTKRDHQRRAERARTAATTAKVEEGK